LAFFAQVTAMYVVFAKIVIITLVFEKNAIFFTENRQKSQKIVIITLTPDVNIEDVAAYSETFISEKLKKS
jgi:hypothetical protein